jgi:hypothetical protein
MGPSNAVRSRGGEQSRARQLHHMQTVTYASVECPFCHEFIEGAAFVSGPYFRTRIVLHLDVCTQRVHLDSNAVIAIADRLFAQSPQIEVH